MNVTIDEKILGLLGSVYYLGLEYDVILASTICISAAFGLYLIVQVVIEFMCFYDELQRLSLTIERSGSHIVKVRVNNYMTKKWECAEIIRHPIVRYI